MTNDRMTNGGDADRWWGESLPRRRPGGGGLPKDPLLDQGELPALDQLVTRAY